MPHKGPCGVVRSFRCAVLHTEDSSALVSCVCVRVLACIFYVINMVKQMQTWVSLAILFFSAFLHCDCSLAVLPICHNGGVHCIRLIPLIWTFAGQTVVLWGPRARANSWGFTFIIAILFCLISVFLLLLLLACFGMFQYVSVCCSFLLLVAYLPSNSTAIL